MEDCNRAIELNPDSVESYLGRSLMQVEDPQSALVDLDRAVEIVERLPTASQQHIGYAKIYTSRGPFIIYSAIIQRPWPIANEPLT